LRAWLGAQLVIESPGPLRPRLQRLATFRRKGPVPKGESRWIRWYVDGLQLRPAQDYLWLPRGLLPQVESLTSLQLVDRRLRFRPQDFGWRGRLFGYQANALRRIIRAEGGMVLAPPGAGKTVVGLALAAQTGQPTVWITHTAPLLDQAMEEARRFLDLPRRAISAVVDGGGEPGTHLTVAMVQTLAQRPDLVRYLAARTGLVICDETHHLGSLRQWAPVVGAFPAYYRVGLTASLERSDGLEPLVRALLGGEVVEIPVRETVKAGTNMLPWIRLVHTHFRHYGAPGWASIQRSRAADGERNRLICTIAAAEHRAGHRVMVLVELLDHARLLHRLLVTHWGVPAEHVCGSTPDEERRKAFAGLSAGRLILIATKLVDEGTNLPAMDRLVLAASARSKRRLIQQAGRVMRAMRGKRDALVYDICDVEEPALAAQMRRRVQLYRELGFRFA